MRYQKKAVEKVSTTILQELRASKLTLNLVVPFL